MRVHVAELLLVFFCFLLTACNVNVIVMDQQAAAATATSFADLAFVQSDYATAHTLLAPQGQELPVGKLADEVSKMHPKNRPTEVRAIEFEPMPGQRSMNIFLKGTRGDEEFFYRFLMVGDKGSGYKVGGLWRGTGPYPPSPRKAL